MKMFIICLLFFWSGCKTIKVNTDLVRPWSTKLALTQIIDEPYIAHFEKEKMSLTFIAAKHAYGIKSDTFITIARAVSVYKPKIIIVEGITDLTNDKRQKILGNNSQCETETFRVCGENLYGAYLAQKNRISWTSAEPSEKTIEEGLRAQNFTKRDILFFYLARQIRQLQIEEGLDKINFENIINKTLAHFSQQYALPNDLIALDFISWFQEKMQKTFILSEIDSETTAPIVGPNTTYLNQISASIGKIRGQHILKVIAAELNAYKHVLVIYGGSHLLTQYDALTDMLGKPKIFKY